MTRVRPSEAQIQAFWTERPMIAPAYGFDRERASPEEIFAHVERVFRDKGTLMQSEGAPLLSNFIDYASLKGARALEIGYGVGWLIEELARAGAEVEGIDLSEAHYALTSHRFRDNPRVHVQVASAEHIPFADETFDFVSAYGVIHHAADDRKCYDEIHRVLKPGGRSFLMLYRRGGPKYWWRKIFVKGVWRGGLRRHGYDVEKFLCSVTDAYEDDSPGAPISRHYSRRDLGRLLSRFSARRIRVCGNRNEWASLPASRLPLTTWFLPRAVREWLVRRSGAYWMVNLTKGRDVS